MQNSYSIIFVLAVALMSPESKTALGRKIETWTFDRLSRDSDVVAIGNVSEIKLVTDKPNEAIYGDTKEEVCIHVLTSLKGNSGTTITVINFRSSDKLANKNEPECMTFEPIPGSGENKPNDAPPNHMPSLAALVGRPQYLLFLRKAPDGTYEPVSGFLNARLSYRELR